MNAFPIFDLTPAVVTGLTAAFCLTIAPMFSNRRLILMAQLAAGLCFSMHYFYLGVSGAAVANVLGAIQTLVAIFAARSRAMGALGYVLIGLMMLGTFYLWQGPISLLSLTAMALIAVGRMQREELPLRFLLISGGLFWILHDALVGAWIAMSADLGALILGMFALVIRFVRIRIEWRPAPPLTASLG